MKPPLFQGLWLCVFRVYRVLLPHEPGTYQAHVEVRAGLARLELAMAVEVLGLEAVLEHERLQDLPELYHLGLGKLLLPDEANPDGVRVVPLAVGAHHAHGTARLDEAIDLGRILGHGGTVAVAQNPVVTHALPSALPVPAVYGPRVAEGRIRTVDYDLLDIPHDFVLLNAAPRPPPGSLQPRYHSHFLPRREMKGYCFASKNVTPKFQTRPSGAQMCGP